MSAIMVDQTDAPGIATGRDGKQYPLPLKQERFCNVYIETGNASEAYRTAYDIDNPAPETVWVNASKILSDTKVKHRINELKKALTACSMVTVHSLTTELEQARQCAADKENAASQVAATMGKARLHGLDKLQDNQGTTVSVTINRGSVQVETHGQTIDIDTEENQ